MSEIHKLRHDLPESVPDPWSWPARVRKDGWWYLRWGSTERPVHKLAFELAWGDGPFDCWWCDRTGLSGRKLQIDHVSGDKDDCRAQNLVPSCIGCNRRKGREYWGPGDRKRRAGGPEQEYVWEPYADVLGAESI